MRSKHTICSSSRCTPPPAATSAPCAKAALPFPPATSSAAAWPSWRRILRMGASRETADPRKRDAAFSTLEHLILHAHHAGVAICVENTTSEMGDPHYLRAFLHE